MYLRTHNLTVCFVFFLLLQGAAGIAELPGRFQNLNSQGTFSVLYFHVPSIHSSQDEASEVLHFEKMIEIFTSESECLIVVRDPESAAMSEAVLSDGKKLKSLWYSEGSEYYISEGTPGGALTGSITYSHPLIYLLRIASLRNSGTDWIGRRISVSEEHGEENTRSIIVEFPHYNIKWVLHYRGEKLTDTINFRQTPAGEYTSGTVYFTYKDSSESSPAEMEIDGFQPIVTNAELPMFSITTTNFGIEESSPQVFQEALREVETNLSEVRAGESSTYISHVKNSIRKQTLPKEIWDRVYRVQQQQHSQRHSGPQDIIEGRSFSFGNTFLAVGGFLVLGGLIILFLRRWE